MEDHGQGLHRTRKTNGADDKFKRENRKPKTRSEEKKTEKGSSEDEENGCTHKMAPVTAQSTFGVQGVNLWCVGQERKRDGKGAEYEDGGER